VKEQAMGNMMNSLLSRYQRMQAQSSAPSVSKDKCAPVCPSCGGLECLCRPRFFPGQLLTDEDLTLLEDYVVKKNRLHNRYLHGWGVVCGLEVVCSPCDAQTVTVRSGYALSPCGNDIIVCKDAVAPVCDLISKCRRKDAQPCAPGPQQPQQPAVGVAVGVQPVGGLAHHPEAVAVAAVANDPCVEGDENWILYICYDEKSSRGITPLRGSAESACCSSCACGGSGSCGCGGGGTGKKSCSCGGGGNGNGKYSCSKTAKPVATVNKRAPAQCEPTLICEGYSFRVCRKPPDTQRAQVGAIVERMTACWDQIKALLLTAPAGQPTQDQLRDWCCRQQQVLVDYLAANPVMECKLLQQVAILCPAVGTSVDPDRVRQQTIAILAVILQHCVCAAILPPCPCPEEDDCVPIAVLTVRKPECSVVKICNVSARKFATTFPALQYWLSALPSGRLLRQAIEKFCCTTFRSRYQTGNVIGRRPIRRAYMAQAAQQRSFSTAVFSAMTRPRKLDIEAMLLAEAGVLDEQQAPFATEDELDNPVDSLLANQFAAPLFEDAVPFDLASLGLKPPPAKPVEDIGELRDRVFEMKRVIDDQKHTIDDLLDRLKDK